MRPRECAILAAEIAASVAQSVVKEFGRAPLTITQRISKGPRSLRASLKWLFRSLKLLSAPERSPTLETVLKMAAGLRRSTLLHPTFVAVTGSCGKTTTALLVGWLLSTAGTCQTRADFNSQRHLARNLLKMDRSTRFCVQELSGSRPGRIREGVRILRPKIGIVTTVGSDHYKNFRGLEATALEKGTLVELLPESGTAILNADDPHVRAMASRARARVVLFGTGPEADFRAVEIAANWPERLALTVKHHDQEARIQTQFVGAHWVTSVLAAVACGIACGVELQVCARAIERFGPSFGRYSLHSKPGTPVYIFDHKAPYWTFAAGFSFLKNARAPRTTIVIGTVSDYPGAASPRYRRIAREALDHADRVVFVGPLASHVSKLERVAEGRLRFFLTAYQANEFLSRDAIDGELILIKGSIAVDHLERLVLSQFENVVCWRERCGKPYACPSCKYFHSPRPAPFGLPESSMESDFQASSA